MTKLFFRQILFVISTFLGISIITFSLVKFAPKNIDTANLEISSNANTGHTIEENIFKQYFHYLDNILDGDLGTSSQTGLPVMDTFLSHLPASVELVVIASLIAFILGIPLGVIAAIKYHQLTDKIINLTAMVAYSIPVFWWGLLLIMFFSLNLGVTPVAGRLSFLYDIEPVTGFILIDTLISTEANHMAAFSDAIMHMLLPILVLATLPTAIIIRITRQTMVLALSKDYILTAQAKGLSTFRIYWVHGFRNAIIPLIDMLGLQISTLMTTAMLTEYLFFWPGIGKWLLDALEKGDYQSLQGGILITTIMVILINAIIELLQAWLNPKIRKSKRIYSG